MTEKKHTSAQEIANLICEREIIAKEKQKPPDHFWNLPKYKPHYKRTIIRVNSLLLIYPHAVIMGVLRKNPWMYSLYFPRLPEFLDKELEEYKKKNSAVSKSEEVERHSTIIAETRKLPKKNRLEDLDE